MSALDKLTSKKALEVLGPIQDKIDAIGAEISALMQELGRPSVWRKNEKYQALHSQKEQLEAEYQQAKERLLVE